MTEAVEDAVLHLQRQPVGDRHTHRSRERQKLRVLAIRLNEHFPQPESFELRLQLPSREVPHDESGRLASSSSLEVEAEPPCQRQEPLQASIDGEEERPP